jgi:hypothetical protein
MFFLASAAGSALSYLSSLQNISGAFQSSGAQSTGQSTPFAAAALAQPPQPPATGGSTNTWPMSSQTMNTLLSAQSQSGESSASQKLFSMLDSNGDGTISKSEFEAAFGQNGKTDQADALLAKLDQDGDGAVNQKELSSALKKGHRHHHAQSAGGLSGGEGTGGSATKNATTQSTTNVDGSTTTTISYGDGSQVTMTTPASGGSSNSGSNGNFLEQLIQRQSQMLSANTGQSLAVNI